MEGMWVACDLRVYKDKLSKVLETLGAEIALDFRVKNMKRLSCWRSWRERRSRAERNNGERKEEVDSKEEDFEAKVIEKDKSRALSKFQSKCRKITRSKRKAEGILSATGEMSCLITTLQGTKHVVVSLIVYVDVSIQSLCWVYFIVKSRGNPFFTLYVCVSVNVWVGCWMFWMLCLMSWYIKPLLFVSIHAHCYSNYWYPFASWG